MYGSIERFSRLSIGAALLQHRKRTPMLQYSCLHGPVLSSANVLSVTAAGRGKFCFFQKADKRDVSLPITLPATPHALRSWPLQTHRQPRQQGCVAYSSSTASQGYPQQHSAPPLWQRILKFMLKLAAGLILFGITSLALLPAIFSSTTGLHAVLAVTNRFVPGQLAVEKVRLSNSSLFMFASAMSNDTCFFRVMASQGWCGSVANCLASD